MAQNIEWKWWWGVGVACEHYYGPLATQIEAVVAALAYAHDNGLADDDMMTIAEARPETIENNVFDSYVVLEHFQNSNEDKVNEDGELVNANPTPEQRMELETALAATLGAWREKHNLFNAYALEFKPDNPSATPTIAELKAETAEGNTL